jgi:hypothetical protein
MRVIFIVKTVPLILDIIMTAQYMNHFGLTIPFIEGTDLLASGPAIKALIIIDMNIGILGYI